MRRATGQRRFCGKGQRAIFRCDAVGQHAKLRTHANIEKALVWAHHHRLHLARDVNDLHQGQRTFVIQTPDVDLLALGAGGINGLLHNFSLIAKAVK